MGTFLVVAAILASGLISSLFARSINIDVSSSAGSLTFSPASTNISVNDQVTWTWKSTGFPPHSTTSDTNGIWDSGLVQGPHSFPFTFTTPGTYPYHCTQHATFGMRGKVVVITNLPPSLAISSPAAGAVFAAPASVAIQVAVTNGSTPVTNVQFLVGVATLTNKTAAPFIATTSPLSAGGYALSVVAKDSGGLAATNSVSINVVNPVAINLTTPARLSGTNFQFSYSANAGLQYIVQRSTNLLVVNWLAITTNTAAGSPVNFTDTNAIANPAFYRVELVPNP